MYLVLDGTGVVTIDVRSDGPAALRFAYLPAADGSEDIDSVFGG